MTDIETTIRESFSQKKIVVLGDLVADQFLNGTIARVSREAPVFILRHDETHTLPGAAANASANVASLGGKAFLIGCVGNDAAGESLLKALANAGVECEGIVVVPGVRTTTKVRVLAGHHYAARQQVIRIDYEDAAPLPANAKDLLRSHLRDAAQAADAILISDYGYSAVFPEIFDDALGYMRSRNIPLIVDSRHRLTMFAGATTATPNREEIEQFLGSDLTTEMCSRFRDELGLEALLVTYGNEGMTLFEKGRPELHLPAVGPAEPVDVTGAGDTVIAAYALALASGLSYRSSAAIADHAGGIVVMKKGTAVAYADELIDSIRSEPGSFSLHAG